MTSQTIHTFSLWPNRIARFLAIAVFSAVIFGGWATTIATGILAILLMIVSCQIERDRFVRGFSVLLLLLVILQGALGINQFWQDDSSLANLYSSMGPLIFAAVVGFCVVTSEWYRRNLLESRPNFPPGSFKRARIFAEALFGLSYLQLVVGSLLRNTNANSSPRGFPHLVYTHLALALLLLLGTWIYWRVTRRLRGSGLRWQINLLALVVLVQVGFGLATWVMKYGFPSWLDQFEFAAGFVVPERTFSQMSLVTAHVAFGAVILGLWTLHIVRFRGLFGVERLSARDTMSCAVSTMKV